jgi:hypothetical protein
MDAHRCTFRTSPRSTAAIHPRVPNMFTITFEDHDVVVHSENDGTRRFHSACVASRYIEARLRRAYAPHRRARRLAENGNAPNARYVRRYEAEVRTDKASITVHSTVHLNDDEVIGLKTYEVVSLNVARRLASAIRDGVWWQAVEYGRFCPYTYGSDVEEALTNLDYLDF